MLLRHGIKAIKKLFKRRFLIFNLKHKIDRKVGITNQRYEDYARLLSGEITDEEKQVLQEKINDPAEKAEFEKLQSVWENYAPAEEHSAQQIWKLTARKLDFEQEPKQFKLTNWMKYAAAALVILSVGLNFYFLATNGSSKNDWVEYTTKKGEVKQITLSDGSSVWLNSESILLCHDKFGKDARNVFLIGEAFFKVTKNPKAPFSVNTSDMTVRVLGTSFSVSNYNNDPFVSACLEEGRVQIISKGKNIAPVYLSPNDQAELKKSDGTLTINNQEQIIAPWREGRFRFHNSSLILIAHQLERKFDCEFIFVDQAAEDLRFTGDFENENLDEILDFLNKAHSFKLKKTGRKYIISIQNP